MWLSHNCFSHVPYLLYNAYNLNSTRSVSAASLTVLMMASCFEATLHIWCLIIVIAEEIGHKREHNDACTQTVAAVVGKKGQIIQTVKKSSQHYICVCVIKLCLAKGITSESVSQSVSHLHAVADNRKFLNLTIICSEPDFAYPILPGVLKKPF